MKLVVALFDAPVPAQRAVSRLAAMGIGGPDVITVPSAAAIAGEPDADAGREPWSLAGDEPRMARYLTRMGIPRDDAAALAEGVRRGGILLAVRAPELSVPIVRSIIEGAAPPDLATHRARWATHPDTVYDWASVEAPVLDPP